MLEEFGRDVFVNVVFARQLDGDTHQIEREHSHPACAVTLFETCPIGKPRAPIENANVIQAKETALKNVVALRVLPVHPPGESEKHLVENRFQKCAVALASLLPFDLKHPPC